MFIYKVDSRIPKKVSRYISNSCYCNCTDM